VEVAETAWRLLTNGGNEEKAATLFMTRVAHSSTCKLVYDLEVSPIISKWTVTRK